MRLLVLGGTAWLGREVAAQALARGHEVTALARGVSGAVPDGVDLVAVDRDDPSAYAAVPGDWDAVVDLTRHPGHARGAAAALAGRAAYLAFVSTISVYAAHDDPHAGTSAPLLTPLDGDLLTDRADYGNAKVACEQAVQAGFGPARSLLARCGLIGGRGDHTHRSSYWPWRFAHPGTADAAVVVPDEPDLSTQLVDVRDLASWLVTCCERRTAGVVDAVGDCLPLAGHLETARAVAGHRGPVLAAAPDWLLAAGVGHWAGDRSMPLWLPLPEFAGMTARNTDPARALGLRCRPLAQTLADALADERAHGWGRRPDEVGDGVGLTDEAARELVERYRTELRSDATTG